MNHALGTLLLAAAAAAAAACATVSDIGKISATTKVKAWWNMHSSSLSSPLP